MEISQSTLTHLKMVLEHWYKDLESLNHRVDKAFEEAYAERDARDNLAQQVAAMEVDIAQMEKVSVNG